MSVGHYPRCVCGGVFAVPICGVTEPEEATANEHNDAAILRCRACRARLTIYVQRSEPWRKRYPLPDQSVFAVSPKEPRS